ncbi:hypothetical protein [Rhodococcus sp. WAY2]|uniref:hypothetical protein n=1 Tax=Rhodococcus sp. WAY2 TaxID=2663121 RepID=UPI00131FE932|nr:hypothetical protein [Rhodococcus sp. WAY2]QHE69517.1 hypothetical protein GFS60_03085 [Rhodococcus sp. WAY2]
MTDTRTTTDHTEIRRWVDRHDGAPARVGNAGSPETVVLRLDFAGGASEEALERISWDDWFSAFDRFALAFRYRDADAGEDGTFFELVPR